MEFSSREFMEQFRAGTLKPIGDVGKCAFCGVVLQESVTGNRRVGDKRACSDCYFTEFGKVIAAHPIRTATVRRGA